MMNINYKCYNGGILLCTIGILPLSKNMNQNKMYTEFSLSKQNKHFHKVNIDDFLSNNSLFYKFRNMFSLSIYYNYLRRFNILIQCPKKNQLGMFHIKQSRLFLLYKFNMTLDTFHIFPYTNKIHDSKYCKQ